MANVKMDLKGTEWELVGWIQRAQRRYSDLVFEYGDGHFSSIKSGNFLTR
jgi:hypothetical protein